jgi:hypothetical protein
MHPSFWGLVKDTSAWGFEMWDTANQYVSTCENSGLLPFLMLVAILVYGFKYLGRARRAGKDRKTALFMWALGSALFANMVAFLGISYFDQTIVAWYALLAMISTATVARSKKALSQVQLAAAPSEAGLAAQVAEEISGLRTAESQ